MSIKGIGRGTILATGDGQGEKRIRIEGHTLLDGALRPIKGNVYDFVYNNELDPPYDTPDAVPWSGDSVVQPATLGALVCYYWDESLTAEGGGTMIVDFYLERAVVAINSDGQFEVASSGESFATEGDTYGYSHIMDPYVSDPIREPVSTVSYSHNKEWSVPFDRNNGADGTIDSSMWEEV